MYYKLKTTLKVLFILELIIALLSSLLYVHLFNTHTQLWFLGSIYPKESIFYFACTHIVLGFFLILMYILYPKLYDVTLSKIKKVVYALLITIYLGTICMHSLYVFASYIFNDNRYHSFDTVEDTQILLANRTVFGGQTRLYQIYNHVFLREINLHGILMDFDETYYDYEIHMNDVLFDIEFKYPNHSRFYTFYVEEGEIKRVTYSIE